MILLIDIGNSGVKFCLQENGFLGEIFHCKIEELSGRLKEIYQVDKFSFIYLSTVRLLDEEFNNQLNSLTDKLVVLSGTNNNLPIKINYSTPETLGVDRVAAAIAANYLFPKKNIIVFDFGTAITIDFISKNGEFKGGNISLGLNTRFKALNHFTSKLPLLSVEEPIKKIGKNTKEAIISGVSLGIIFEVQYYIAQNPNHLVIFTGGDAFYFAKKMKSSIFVVCNLVLMGLLVLSKFNKSE